MATWVLVPCLVSLRDEFNALSPGRDKASDGSIGDQAHAGSSSDHNADETGSTPSEDSDSRNEVHAIDVDKDLRRSGWTMERAVKIIIARHRTGKDDRLQNIIYNREIWSRSWGWTARGYTGSNPHDKHAHFSARYTTAQEADTSPWGLLEAADQDEGEIMIKKGDQSEEVKYWQYVLWDLGYLSTAEVDGTYGNVTAAAVNKYRKNVAGSEPITYLSGWQAFHMTRAMMQKHSGKDGAPGKDGSLTGELTVTGGVLTVTTGEE